MRTKDHLTTSGLKKKQTKTTPVALLPLLHKQRLLAPKP
jgi:hypothetical protein